MLKRFRTILQANLPTKLDEIEAEYSTEDIAEYGAVLTLEDVANANYWIQGPPETINAKTFIAIGVNGIVINSRGPAVAKSYEIFVLFGHTGLRNDPNFDRIESKIFRYTRALEEVIRENFDKVLPGFSLAQALEMPAEPGFQLQTGETIRVSGLVFSATVA